MVLRNGEPDLRFTKSKGIEHMTAWKAAEKKVALLTGGKRIGVTGLATNDVEHGRLAIEVKHTARPPAFVVNALAQAKDNMTGDKVPIAVIHPKGTRQYIVCLDLLDLMALIGEHEALGLVVNNDTE
jgi:hypothetical protein